MRTSTTLTSATTAITLAALLGGCAASSAAPSSQPTTFDTAAAEAKEKADAYAGSEKSLRALYAETPKWLNSPMPIRLYAAREFRAQHNEWVAGLKRDGLTVKGSSQLVSITPEEYMGVPRFQTTMKTCSIVTGGIYNKDGENVTVDPSGKPVADKPHRVESRYHLQRVPDDGRWEIIDETQLGPC